MGSSFGHHELQIRPFTSWVFLVQFPDAAAHPKIGMIGFNAEGECGMLQANEIPCIVSERCKLIQVADLRISDIIRVQRAQQWLHIDKNTALRCPSCAGCLAASQGLDVCWTHKSQASSSRENSIVHTLGVLNEHGMLGIRARWQNDTDGNGPHVIIVHIVGDAECTAACIGDQWVPLRAPVPAFSSVLWQAPPRSRYDT